MKNKLFNDLEFKKELLEWENIYLRLKSLARLTENQEEKFKQLDESWERLKDGLKKLYS